MKIVVKALIFLTLLFLLPLPLNGQAVANSYEIVLYESTINLTEGFTFTRIDGYVQVEGSDGVLSNVLQGEHILDPHTGIGGEIYSNYFYLDVLSNEAGSFTLELELSELVRKDGSGYFLDDNGNGVRDLGEGSIKLPTYTVIPEVTLDQALSYQSSMTGFLAITGTAPDAAGQDIGLRYQGEAFLSTYEIADNGVFGFMIDAGNAFDHGGVLEIVLEMGQPDAGTAISGGIVVVTGSVDAIPLDVGAYPAAFSEGILHSNIEVSLSNLPDAYIDGDHLISNHQFYTRLLDEDDALITVVDDLTLLVNSGISTNLTYSPFNIAALKKLEPGSYTIETTLKAGTLQIAVGQTELEVLEAAEDTMIGMGLLSGIKTGQLELDFGGQDGLSNQDDLVFYDSGTPINHTNGGYVFKYYAPGESQQIIHTLMTRDLGGSAYPTLLPAGLLAKQFLGEDVSRAVIPLYQGGEFQYSIEVYALQEGYYRQIFRDSGSFTAASYQVSIGNAIVYTGEEQDQTITVTEYDGTPVNNAIIYYGHDIYGVSNPQYKRTVTSGLNEAGVYDGEKAYLFLNNATTNVIGGRYTVEDWMVEGSGSLNFVVYHLNSDSTATLMAVVENGVSILGSDVWSVTVDKDVASPGQEQEYVLTVRDDNGLRVVPAIIDIFEDGIGRRTIGSIEINANIMNDGIHIIHTCQGTTSETIVFRASSADGTQTGEAVVDVMSTQLNFTSDTAGEITEFFTTPLAFTVINPSDGDPLPLDLSYQFVNLGTDASATLSAASGSNNVVGDGIIEGADSYDLKVLVKNLNHTEIEYAGVVPVLQIYLGTQGDDSDQLLAEIPIGTAELVSDPASLVSGLNTITLTYQDAEGQPLADRMISINGSNVGTTNGNGQFSYSSLAATTLNVFAQTDVSDVYVELVIKYNGSSGGTSGNDVVRAPRYVSSPTATITINNPYAMLRIGIGNKEEDFFIPTKTYSGQVTDLQPGENIVQVNILDERYLFFNYEVKIFYDAPVEPLVLQIGVEGIYGTPTFLLGTTMVPVRFVEQLRAEVFWDAATKTATYVRGDTEIIVSVGQDYAWINGQWSKLTQAPYINQKGRLMVPIRMIAEELGFNVQWTSNKEPITISK